MGDPGLLLVDRYRLGVHGMTEWLYRYRIVSLFAVLWAMVLVTYATLRVFGLMEQVSGAVATAYSALLGIPAAGFGLWKWRNSGGREDQADT